MCWLLTVEVFCRKNWQTLSAYSDLCTNIFEKMVTPFVVPFKLEKNAMDWKMSETKRWCDVCFVLLNFILQSLTSVPEIKDYLHLIKLVPLCNLTFFFVWSQLIAICFCDASSLTVAYSFTILPSLITLWTKAKVDCRAVSVLSGFLKTWFSCL